MHTVRRAESRMARVCAAAVLLSSVTALPIRAESPADAPAGAERIEAFRDGMRNVIENARDHVFPALVNIRVVTTQHWGGRGQKGVAVGSGVIISEDGYVVTNFHVTNNGSKFECALSDMQEAPAELVAEDPLTDLAVLKIDRSALADPDAPLPFAQFGDSNELQVGDYVMAMGSPWALSRSVSLGVVSNTERVFTSMIATDEPDEMYIERDQRSGLFTRWIQHDAAISPGNSGGPLVNLKGEVVGINELGRFFGGDMGFAIPSNIARQVVDALIAHNEVPRSWIGISVKPIQKTGFEKGVLVNSVIEESPAQKAGLRAGDLITSLNGDPVTVRFAEELPPLLKQVADLDIGSKLKVTYERDGETHDATITTAALEKDRGEETELKAWGFTAMELTAKMARDRKLDSTEGVLISGVRSGGPAQTAEPPLQRNDIIRAIDNEPVPDLKALVQRYEDIDAADSPEDYLLVAFERKGQQYVTLLNPRPDDDPDPPREAPKAWLGIATQPVVKKLAEQLHHPDTGGFRITRVYPHTTAAESGLKVGDLIVKLNGDALRVRGMQDAGMLARNIRKLDIDSDATLTVLRGDDTIDVKAPLEKARVQPDEARRARDQEFEIVVREVTFFDRDENRWDDSIDGVIVFQVESAGWAGLAGVRAGDLIMRIGDHDIRNLDDFRAAMEAVKKEQPERVVFVLYRGVGTHFQFVEPDWKPTADESDN